MAKMMMKQFYWAASTAVNEEKLFDGEKMRNVEMKLCARVRADVRVPVLHHAKPGCQRHLQRNGDMKSTVQ